MRTKIRLAFFLPLVLILLLTGCAQNAALYSAETFNTPNTTDTNTSTEETIALTDDPSSDSDLITLRLLTVGSDSHEYTSQLTALIDIFNETYPDVTIEIETPPADEEERQVFIDNLRLQLQQDNGPDLYLLPTAYPGTGKERLFPDVNIAMRQGYFADINTYYTEDVGLDKDGLVNTVMDAGMVGSARYTLPLRYDYPAAYTDITRMNQAGLYESSFTAGYTALMEEVVRLDETRAALGLYNRHWPNLFPDFLDYDTGEVLLSESELTAFLGTLQQYYTVYDWKTVANPSSIYLLSHGLSWVQDDQYISCSYLANCLAEVAVAQVLGIDLGMFPITGASGEIVADVTFYGAVGASCHHPEIAYQFLRLFLTEDAQWEELAEPGSGSMYLSAFSLPGYPVRTYDSVLPMYQNLYERDATWLFDDELSPEGLARKEALAQVQLTDADVPILWENIDICRYPAVEIEQTLVDLIAQLNVINYETGIGSATDVDIPTLAKDYIATLEAYLQRSLGTR